MPGRMRVRETRIIPTTVAASLQSIQMTATTTAPVASAWSSVVASITRHHTKHIDSICQRFQVRGWCKMPIHPHALLQLCPAKLLGWDRTGLFRLNHNRCAWVHKQHLSTSLQLLLYSPNRPPYLQAPPCAQIGVSVQRAGPHTYPVQSVFQ